MDELWLKRVNNDALSLMLTGKTWPDAAEVLRKRYERVLKRVDQVTSEDVFEGLMNAYARAFDPHSSYFSPRSSEEYRIQMSLNYEGIGASLQVVDDYVTIMNVLEGGPAAAAGTLSTNDRIIGVGQGHEGPFTDVIGWRLDDVVQLIRGKAGTSVRLQVLPAGAAPGSPEKVMEFVRNKVTLEAQAAHKEVKTVARNGRTLKIGVITVPGFYQDIAAQNAGDQSYRSTTHDVLKLLRELKSENVEGLVLDLRGDGGGYLPEATALTGLFINHGPVVQLRDTAGRLEVLDDPEPAPAYDGPLAVLVDRLSASASGIFAGAIQDYRRGVTLGQTAFGKGTVQNLVPLDRWSPKPVSGQLTVHRLRRPAIEGHQVLHRALAEGGLAEDHAAVIVLDRASEDLRSRGAQPVDQHCQRTVVGRCGLRVIQHLEPACGIAQLHHRAVIDEKSGERRGLGEVAAAVTAQVEDQALHVLALELAQQFQHIVRGAAVALVAGVLRGNVLVEPGHRDHPDLERAAVARHGLHFLMRGLRFERHLVAHELHDLLGAPGGRAGRQYLQAHRCAGLAADQLHHVIQPPADDVGERTLVSLAHTDDAVVGAERAGCRRRAAFEHVHDGDVVVHHLERGADALVVEAHLDAVLLGAAR